jgi:hypothetical protein
MTEREEIFEMLNKSAFDWDVITDDHECLRVVFFYEEEEEDEE